jgi:hypothetical protein
MKFKDMPAKEKMKYAAIIALMVLIAALSYNALIAKKAAAPAPAVVEAAPAAPAPEAK